MTTRPTGFPVGAQGIAVVGGLRVPRGNRVPIVMGCLRDARVAPRYPAFEPNRPAITLEERINLCRTDTWPRRCWNDDNS